MNTTSKTLPFSAGMMTLVPAIPMELRLKLPSPVPVTKQALPDMKRTRLLHTSRERTRRRENPPSPERTRTRTGSPPIMAATRIETLPGMERTRIEALLNMESRRDATRTRGKIKTRPMICSSRALTSCQG